MFVYIVFVDNPKADVVVLFHANNKLKSKEFNKGLELFIYKLFQKAQIDSGEARGAVINYGSSAQEVFGLDKFNTKSALRKEIQKMKPKPYRNSKANLVAGLNLARTRTFTSGRGSRLSEGVPSALIIITDMKSTSNAQVAQREINELKRQGVRVFTVGTYRADESELLSLASSPQDYQHARSFNDLVKGNDALDKITNQIRACKLQQFLVENFLTID